MRRDDVPEQDVVLEAELAEDAVHDRRRRLGGTTAGELPLGRERDSRDPGSAIAGRLADEQDRRPCAVSEVRGQPVAEERRVRSGGVLVERRADARTRKRLDKSQILHGMTLARRRVVVHGRVQGVWFRESARQRAERLGVAGWVRNRPDGAVEAELEGDGEDVEVLVSWFRHGPADARVDSVEVEELLPTGERGFAARR
jgi:acylphosphatase